MKTRQGLCVGVCLLLVLGWIPLVRAADIYEGKPISSIEFDPARQPLRTDELLSMIPLRAGEPMSASKVQDSIQRLYATGEYAEIAVDATLLDGQVRLKFITKPNFFISHIGATGVPEPPNAGQLAVATKLQLGAEFDPGAVQQAVQSISDLLRRNGFYNATVETLTSGRSDTQEQDVDFTIDPDKRAKYDGINLTGDFVRSPKAIVNSTGWKHFGGMLGWNSVTDNRTQEGVANARSWYPKHNYPLAHITLVKLDFHPETNRVTPTLNIDSGPLVTVKVQGAKVSGGTLRSLLPIYEERALDKDLLVEGVRNLTEYFQSQGYFNAQVDFKTAEPAHDDAYIEYDVTKGIRYKLVKLEFNGNSYFDDATLRERMYIIPATVLRYRRGRYSRDYLDKDLDAIRDLYRSNGFRDVEVTSRELYEYKGKPGTIALFIEIKEGPQWFVSTLQLEGFDEGERKNLLSILHSTEGQPYSDLNVASDRDSILDYYFNNGYPNAKFDFTATPSGEPQRMDLRFIVTPGKREFVRGVLVRGLKKTSPGLVANRISLMPDDPLSQNQITDSQRRLYDLGIFARVNTAIQNPDGDEPSKYVLYSLEEAHQYTFNYGLGAEIARIGGGTTALDSPAGATGFSPRITLGISRLNFLGLGHILSLQTLASTLEQRALFTYLAPQFEGNPKLNLQFTALVDVSRDVRTFSSRREEGSVQLGQKLSRANQFQYRFTYRKVNVLGTPLIEPELIPLLSQPVREGILSASFIQDHRDDPIDAHRGYYNTVDVGVAAAAFGSQTGFVRVVARNSTYYRLTRNVVFARSTNFGDIARFAGQADIVLAERFFSGGSSSQRAFPDFQAGPRDPITGFPIGGKALLLNTVELRFPLIGDNIGGVLFNDIGNVYSSLGDISFRFRQRDLQDFNYGVQSYGFGIRYKTPVGPVRVDLSLSPNSPRFFGFQGTQEQLLFGGGQQVVQRINVFQFHISLGQAF